MPWTKIKISHYESWGTGHFSHQRRCSSAVQPQTRGVKRSLILIKKDFKTPRDRLPTTSSACFVCSTCLFSSFLMQSLHYSQRWADYATPERQTCFSSGDPTRSEVGLHNNTRSSKVLKLKEAELENTRRVLQFVMNCCTWEVSFIRLNIPDANDSVTKPHVNLHGTF